MEQKLNRPRSEVKQQLFEKTIRYTMIGFAIICAIAVLTCVIVNLAVDKKITWSVIPTAAILYSYAGIHALAFSKKSRLLGAIGCFSVLLLPLLGIIQITLYSRMKIGTIWFWKYALPITLVWLLIIWIGILCYQILRLNLFLSLSITSFLSIIGNLATNYIAGEYVSFGEVVNHFVENGLGLTIIGFLFLIMGIRVFSSETNQEL